MEIKAIETLYKGYRFRSRLEARWAVFFDALGLVWEYEVEGFTLPSGAWYLPDFLVHYPSGRSEWFEIKGDARKISDGEWRKMAEFNAERGLTLLDGVPDRRLYCTIPQALGDFACGVHPLPPKPHHSDRHNLADSDRWGRLIVPDDNGERLFAEGYEYEFFGLCVRDTWSSNPPPSSRLDNPDPLGLLFTRFDHAVVCARQARFEHGQTPVFA